MKILMVGDIVGGAGRRMFAEVVPELRRRGEIHAIVANAENAAGGSGVTMELIKELLGAGADVITLGDHTWGQKGMEAVFAGEKRVLRPANFPPECPGQGWIVAQTPLGPLAVVSLLGRVFMPPIDCPFRQIDSTLKSIPGGVITVVDFHAEATSEKIAMGRHLDGRVAAVAGTHTHVQTSDATVLAGGTGYITDLGMTGPSDGVIGRDTKAVLHKFITGMPSRFEVATGSCVFEGAIFEIDRITRQCVSVRALRLREGELGK